MSNEFLMEVFFIKLKANGYLKNITENTTEFIDTNVIYNKDKISYLIADTSYKITLLDNQVLFVRNNEKFTHKFLFDIDKITKSEYYIKELNTSIEILIKTTKLIKNEKSLRIDYEVIDNQNKYSYELDME